ncbi:hypothetical protein [Zavarzinia sp. CC-PAN008]|uniref:hypothetical protein n=1 Tax=Zavarzinia sp. CC-PAN008 TaxID=3243332 RepID=UPI003F748289
MKRILSPVLLGAVFAAVLAAAPANAVSPDDGPKAFSDRAYEQHLELIRKARMACEVSSAGIPDYQGCLVQKLDYYVQESQDPELQQLHALLPLRFRYNPDRLGLRPSHLLSTPFPS